MGYKLRNPFYKNEYETVVSDVYAMSIGEHDPAYDSTGEELLLVELNADKRICEYRRFSGDLFKGVNTKYGNLFKLIITHKQLETTIRIKPIKKNKDVFKRLDDYHWEHVD